MTQVKLWCEACGVITRWENGQCRGTDGITPHAPVTSPDAYSMLRHTTVTPLPTVQTDVTASWDCRPHLTLTTNGAVCLACGGHDGCFAHCIRH